MYVVFYFVQLFVRQLSRNGLSIVSYIKLDAKYIHTCSYIIKVYAITCNGSELKASCADYAVLRQLGHLVK